MKELLHRQYRNRQAFQNYIGFYSGYKWRFLAVWILFAIKFSPVYIIPILTAVAINMLTEGTLGDTEIIWLLVTGFVVIAQNVPMHMWFVYVMSVPCRNVERDLRSALCTRLQHLSIPYHTANKLGELQNKITRDVESVENMTRMLMETVPGILLSLLVAISVTLIKAPGFVIFYLSAVPLSVCFVVLIRNQLTQRNHDFRRSIEEMSGKVTEMIRLIPITRAHNAEDVEINIVNKRLEKIRSTGLKVDYINSVFNSINWAMLMLLNLATFILVIVLYQKGILKIGIGDIGLLTGYFGQIIGNVLAAMNCLPAITKGLESVQSIGEVLECKDLELNEGKPKVEKVNGEFVFDHVYFKYPGSDAHALEDFSLRVAPGETIAFAGHSGAGKSTIANLVIGFTRPSSGHIYLDGVDMNDIDLRSYRKKISVVTQETLLFDGTIYENICYGINATEQELRQAIADADLTDLITSLPEGLNTRIRENGGRLSGGQKQRIAIARALLRDPKILILDEATSALDVESETQIKKALDRLVKGRTTFVIAHRLSTIRNADRIAVMENGRLKEIGNYQELIDLNGIYAEMERKFTAAQ